MSVSLNSVFARTYQYPSTEIYDVNGTLLGTRYRIVGLDGPDEAFVSDGEEYAWTSLRTPSMTMRFVDREALRRELGRLYVANVGSPPPDVVTVFPDANLSETEHDALRDATHSAREWATLNGFPKQFTQKLEQLGDTPRDVKTVLARTRSVQTEWAAFAREGNTRRAYKFKNRLPMHEIQHEMRRRLWERGHTPLTEYLTWSPNRKEG